MIIFVLVFTPSVYRFTWIRDVSFSVYALLGLGYVEEAADFGRWLRDRVEETKDQAHWDQPEEGSGKPAAAARTSPTAGSSTGSHSTAPSGIQLAQPLMGFITPTGPMWLSTLEAMNGELVSDSLVYRCNPSASPDGLRGHEDTFSLCSVNFQHSGVRW